MAGKCIKNPENVEELDKLYNEWIYRQTEVQALLDLVDANPEIFNDENEIVEISEEEAIQDDCRIVLEDITNKIIKNLGN